MTPLLLVALLNIYYAGHYAREKLIGPDEGLWLLWGMTGAEPYKDYIDCKPPGIHVWMWLLAKLTGRRLAWMKFIHHAAIGACAVIVTARYGLGAGLAATWFTQSAWLLSFQSWNDALGAALLVAGMSLPPYPGLCVMALAVAFNIKVALPGLVWIGFTPDFWLTALFLSGAGGLALGGLYLLYKDKFKGWWFQAVTVPARMTRWRKAGEPPFWVEWPSFLAVSLFMATAATGLAFMAGPVRWGVVLSALSYIAFNTTGRVWRPNHFAPLAVVAAASPDPALMGLVIAAELVSVRLLWKSPWEVCYPGIVGILKEAQAVGEYVKGKAQRLWVNSWYTQVYIYAGCRPRWGTVEQIEIISVIPRQANERDRRLYQEPPDYIVVSHGATPYDYHKRQVVYSGTYFKVLK